MVRQVEHRNRPPVGQRDGLARATGFWRPLVLGLGPVRRPANNEVHRSVEVLAKNLVRVPAHELHRGIREPVKRRMHNPGHANSLNTGVVERRRIPIEPNPGQEDLFGQSAFLERRIRADGRAAAQRVVALCCCPIARRAGPGG